MAPSANIGLDAAIFEAVHGSAPDLAGKGIANPLALLVAAGLMLDHIDRSELADQLRKAIHQTLNEDKVRTGDLGGTASTKEFAQAIVGRLKRLGILIVDACISTRSTRIDAYLKKNVSRPGFHQKAA